VEWIAHPGWFYRISKFLLPFLHHPFIPASFFLSEIKQPPTDLENYVLKPLFSFAGQGVSSMSPLQTWTDTTAGELDITTQSHLCRSDPYSGYPGQGRDPAPVPLEGWRSRPTLAINLARLSKGKMIGVRYNKDKEWWVQCVFFRAMRSCVGSTAYM